MKLNIGDKIVYPMHGAGEIDHLEECEVLGEKKSYYILKLPFGNVKVMIPLDNLENIGLRNIIAKEKIDDLKRILQDTPEQILGSWNKRFQANLSRMKSGNIDDVAAVVRNLIIQNRKRKISSGEARLLDQAKQILISELTYAFEKNAEEVEAWIIHLLDEANPNSLVAEAEIVPKEKKSRVKKF